MPIFVTVQPDSATYAECLIYATGTPMLAIHDPSASVMVTIGQDSGSALRSAQFAAQLVRAGQQFVHEARRCAGLTDITAAGSLNTAPLDMEAPANLWPREGLS
ncbi:hypothetical protein SAMN05216215_108311 [Saccharopolyspora shandongensis]|uniref:Uncharacterized protein n=1 Tax=Saccharopolyspora shandongensis TaxID=418495 RepID=A0A1H3THL3_9PSEU|nr:hypothetical protein [Saccharopolyspora shandongensis]SDZ49590.1 hypothetical protein SAMN05216215_108311 [Saccharopolyspora shandongensis]